MPDFFATITEQSPEALEMIANVLELRSAIPEQRAMLEAYLSEMTFPEQAHVLEVGCGTGPVCRALSAWPGVAQVTGIDPSPTLLDKARTLSNGMTNLSFQEADGRSLPFPDGTFDIVILHTLLSHFPAPQEAIHEAWRVLSPGGLLGICDGDFATATLAIADHDPLQACANAFVDGFVHNKWLIRQLPKLVEAAGFRVGPLRSYGFVETVEPGLMMSWVDRGADALAAAGCIGDALAVVFKAEGRRRAEIGTFFGHMTYASLIAHKSA